MSIRGLPSGPKSKAWDTLVGIAKSVTHEDFVDHIMSQIIAAVAQDNPDGVREWILVALLATYVDAVESEVDWLKDKSKAIHPDVLIRMSDAAAVTAKVMAARFTEGSGASFEHINNTFKRAAGEELPS